MSTRSTRARSRATHASSTPGTARQGPYYEPPSADLPSLYPVHDGSYGVNTLINIDPVSVGKKRGRKPKAGFINEDEEDRRFARRMKGRDGKRYAMENDLKKIIEETVEEAERADEGDQEMDYLEQEEPDVPYLPQPETQQVGSQNGFYEDQYPQSGQAAFAGATNAAGDRQPDPETWDIYETGTQHEDTHETEHQREPEDQEQTGVQERAEDREQTGPEGRDDGSERWDIRSIIEPDFPEPLPPIPTLGRFFTSKKESKMRPPYAPVQYRSPDPYALIHNRYPSAPPSTEVSFYGVPTGTGAMGPRSPSDFDFRPSSSKSFNTENTLYGNAALRTPQSRAGSAPMPSASPAKADPQQGNFTTTKQPTIENAEGLKINQGAVTAGPSSSIQAYFASIPELTNNIYNYLNADPPPLEPSENTRPDGLSQDEWKIINDLINDMRGVPRQQPSSASYLPIQSLDHLGDDEIQAVKYLISDMGSDRDRAAQISAKLDEVIRYRAEVSRREKNRLANQLRTGNGAPSINANGSTDVNTGDNSYDYREADVPHGNYGPPQYPAPNYTIPNSTQNAAPQPMQYVDDDEDARTIENFDDADDEGADDNDADDRAASKSSLASSLSDSSEDYRALPKKKQPRAALGRKQRSSNWSLESLNPWRNVAFVFLSILGGAWILLTIISRGSVPSYDPISPDAGARCCGWGSIKNGFRQIIPSGIGNGFRNEKTYEAQSKAMQDLLSRIPDTVFVELDSNGKPRITEDFWHALRNLIKEDNIILTLENATKDGPQISDAHWLAIKSRLNKHRFEIPQVRNASSGGDEGRADKGQCLRFWDTWVSQNEELLRKKVGGAALSREEFAKLFREEIRAYQQDIRRELAAQDARIKDIIDTVARLGRSAKDSQGLTESEVRAICDAVVKRAIENAKLDAMANGRIRGQANDMFINQVNFFALGSGATVDPDLSSKRWVAPKDHHKHQSKNWFQRGPRLLPPSAAVSPWSEEGECFCAGRIVRDKPQINVDVGVLTSRFIIPQHLVVENILAGSTLEPGTMPKDIEVWVQIEEVTLREEVRAFSVNNLPATPENSSTTAPNPLDESFVKIGHFVYENRDFGDGVQVFKMSGELSRMRVVTNTIIVRGVTNYGDDHTCFYRLRMYGEVVDEGPWQKSEKGSRR